MTRCLYNHTRTNEDKTGDPDAWVNMKRVCGPLVAQTYMQIRPFFNTSSANQKIAIARVTCEWQRESTLHFSRIPRAIFYWKVSRSLYALSILSNHVQIKMAQFKVDGFAIVTGVCFTHVNTFDKPTLR